MTTARLSGTLAPSATAPAATAPRPKLRKDFREELERRLEGWLGRPGTPQRAKVESLVEGILGEPDGKGLRHVDVQKLDLKQLNELARLQKASEDFEAVFVKGLLSQMRRTSMAEDGGPMGDLAKDFMDQAVAESVARSGSSLGIAKTVFVEMAQRLVSTVDLNAAKTGDQ